MSACLRSLAGGFRSLLRNPGLALTVLLANLLLAVPFAALRGDLAGAFAPLLLDLGLVAWTVERLTGGALPAGPSWPGTAADPAFLALGAAYGLLHVFLAGGLLAVLRAPAGGWSFRGLVHGSRFYFGRLLRVALLALGCAALVLAACAPLARWSDDLARGAAGEPSALLLAGRRALLLLPLVAVHMVASYAKVIVVCEERRSAALAVLSSVGFCLRNLVPAAGHYVIVAAGALLLLWLFGLAGPVPGVTGWTSQPPALALQVLLGISLRLGLLASQLELQQAHVRPA